MSDVGFYEDVDAETASLSGPIIDEGDTIFQSKPIPKASDVRGGISMITGRFTSATGFDQFGDQCRANGGKLVPLDTKNSGVCIQHPVR